MISSGGSSVLMTSAALGLLLRVGYELDRAQRQVARLRGDAMPAAAAANANPPPATTQALPLAARSERGGRRARIEPVLGQPVPAGTGGWHALRKRS
jgi:cell division protein FtsW